MWDFFLGLPFNFPTLGRNNYNTIPSAGVTVGTDAVTIELPAHSLYRRNYVGSFYLNLRTAIPAGTTATLPVNISSNGVSLPLMETEGTPAAAASAPVAQGQDAATADFNDFNK